MLYIIQCFDSLHNTNKTNTQSYLLNIATSYYDKCRYTHICCTTSAHTHERAKSDNRVIADDDVSITESHVHTI